jgi:hypothetical protein
MSDSDTPAIAPPAPASRAVRFVNGVLAFGAAWFAVQAVFTVHTGRNTKVAITCAVLAVLLVLARRLGVSARTNIALLLIPLLLGLHGFELRLARMKPAAATAAHSAGRPWDNRSQAEVVDELSKGGNAAAPTVQPKSVILLENGTIKTDGGELAPLSSISLTPTVLCNEGGEWAIYESDEHGFVNPKGSWSASPMDLGLVGDSFTQGACVRPEVSWVGHVRKRGFRLVNLGMGGNGPLIELAGIREYLSRVKPRHVLWLYFRNDMDDLNVEKAIPLLRRYLEPDFKQGLFDKQAHIDSAVRGLVARKAPFAARWPKGLSSVGLTRASTPVWLQDLVMAETNTSFTAVLRLDRIGETFKLRAAAEPPDFALFEAVLKQAKAEVAAWGGTLHFVYLPDLWYLGQNKKDHPNRAKVLEAAKNAALPILDAHLPFEQEPDLEALRYHPLAHYSPLGNEVVARIIGDYLAKQTL